MHFPKLGEVELGYLALHPVVLQQKQGFCFLLFFGAPLNAGHLNTNNSFQWFLDKSYKCCYYFLCYGSSRGNSFYPHRGMFWDNYVIRVKYDWICLASVRESLSNIWVFFILQTLQHSTCAFLFFDLCIIKIAFVIHEFYTSIVKRAIFFFMVLISGLHNRGPFIMSFL